ncbi:endonuclease/exonuclease/phosphatase family protein [Rhodosalinus sp. K401]|uniref:endonuclease/exonuclease/phosphatase family protein n=1 Tax=Rhodosalinus sp. K401 TaxID=3239195 RepID=UPI003525368B
MRLATYNVEWFDALFDDEGGLLADDARSGRRGVTRFEQATALGIVFTALDADAVLVVEAPAAHRGRDGVRALESFAAIYGLRTRRALMGFANDTRQEIALLYDPDAVTARHDPRGGLSDEDGEPPRFDQPFRIDLDIDDRVDRVAFSKPPLEVALASAGGARSLRLIGVHLKSKAPHGARDRDAVMRAAIANRRKQLAQAIWLRRRVDADLARGSDVIVLGDLNDGPGLDVYEDLFGRSSVEIVMGGDGENGLFDPHAREALERRLGAQPSTARFYLDTERRFLAALLDYVMVSPGLMACRPAWRIWHPFDDPVCWETPELRGALLTASDHFPVTLDLDIAARS